MTPDPECGGACCSCRDPERCVCEPCDRCKREMVEHERRLGERLFARPGFSCMDGEPLLSERDMLNELLFLSGRIGGDIKF